MLVLRPRRPLGISPRRAALMSRFLSWSIVVVVLAGVMLPTMPRTPAAAAPDDSTGALGGVATESLLVGGDERPLESMLPPDLTPGLARALEQARSGRALSNPKI